MCRKFMSAGYQDLSSRLVKALREAIETDMGDATERDVSVSPTQSAVFQVRKLHAESKAWISKTVSGLATPRSSTCSHVSNLWCKAP